MGCSAGHQLPLVSLPSPCHSLPFFCSVRSQSALCPPSRVWSPPQPSALRRVPLRQGPVPLAFMPASLGGREHSGPFPPMPSAQPEGQRRLSGQDPVAVGPRLLEAAAERWAGEHGAFAFCLSDRTVWGRERGPLFHVLSRINKFLQLCHQGWGSEVGRPRPPESSLGLLEQQDSSLRGLGARAARCLRSSPGQVREVLSEPLSSSLNWEVLCSSLLGWRGRGRMCQSLSSAVEGPCPWGSPGGPATAGGEMIRTA